MVGNSLSTVWKLAAIAIFVAILEAAQKQTLEVRGEILPHASASVSLHAVANPYSTSTTAGIGGVFRFKNVEPGEYTISVYVQDLGETSTTINVSPSTADAKGRVTVTIETTGDAAQRERAATLSARDWAIPEQAKRKYDDAVRKIAKRDFDAATASLQQAVDLAPRFAAAWNHLGTIAYQRQRYSDAERYFRQGIQANPDAYEPLVNLGGVLLNLNNAAEALKYNLEAVRRRPKDALAQSQLGMTYLMQNDLARAEKPLLEACRLDPDHFSHPQLSLAQLYVRRKEFRKAADELEDFVRRHPDWPSAAGMRETVRRLRE